MRKQSLLDALKNYRLIKDKFPSLEEVSKDFVKHNNLPKPAKVQETDSGLILYLGKTGLVILSSKSSDRILESDFQPYIGGDGSHKYTCDRMIYTLSGKLNGKRISLKTEMSYTEDYKMEKHGPPEFLPTPVATGNDKKYVFRKDNEPYWFLEKARR